MKSKENLVFLGMMGSGKSSIGSLVAKKLKLDFIDVDKEIEKELGLTISKIFETKGEDYFRKYEEKITLKILKLNTVVVSLRWRSICKQNYQKRNTKKPYLFLVKLG
jgi:shikimate kinase/shikimate kinase/3-dehydroquinate synthase